MVLKLLKKPCYFKRKAVSNLFPTRFDFKSYLRDGLKTRLLSKGVKILLRKIKVLHFNQQNAFKTKVLAQFCFKKLLTSTGKPNSFQNKPCFQKWFATVP
jgi:hypothetical protein